MRLCRAHRSNVEKFVSDLVQPITPTLVLGPVFSWRGLASNTRDSLADIGLLDRPTLPETRECESHFVLDQQSDLGQDLLEPAEHPRAEITSGQSGVGYSWTKS